MKLEFELSDSDIERIARRVAELVSPAGEPEPKSLTLTPAEAAELIGAGYDDEAVKNLCHAGELDFHRKSDAKKSPYVISRASVLAFVRRRNWAQEQEANERRERLAQVGKMRRKPLAPQPTPIGPGESLEGRAPMRPSKPKASSSQRDG